MAMIQSRTPMPEVFQAHGDAEFHGPGVLLADDRPDFWTRGFVFSGMM
jgi:hypothetical protein